MVVRKQKKNKKQRGSKTHGWGAMKKHRGAGNRGGRGMAGTGKRADQNKPSFWHETYFGKFGFKKKNIQNVLTPVNIVFFEEHLADLLEDKQITEENGKYVIDADKLNIKILGTGRITKKFKVITSLITDKAKEKIEQAGGEVVIREKKAKKSEERNKAEANSAKTAAKAKAED